MDSEPSHLRWELQGVPETAPESLPFAGSDAEIWATSPSWKMIFGFRLPLGFSGDSEWHKSDQTLALAHFNSLHAACAYGQTHA